MMLLACWWILGSVWVGWHAYDLGKSWRTYGIMSIVLSPPVGILLLSIFKNHKKILN